VETTVRRSKAQTRVLEQYLKAQADEGAGKATCMSKSRGRCSRHLNKSARRQQQIGSIAIGKNADLLVVKGDPASHISDIENVEIVFKDGAGYDSRKLLDAASGHYGEF
jgi:hypothetical protein